jgi:hypothetical protein
VDEGPQLIGELDEALPRLADMHEPQPGGLELRLLILGERAKDQAVARQHQTASHVVHGQDDALRERGEFIHSGDSSASGIVGRTKALEEPGSNGRVN